MNIKYSVILGSVVLLLASHFVVADDNVGTVKTIIGEVNVIRNGVPLRASTGMKLLAIDEITTGKNSAAGLTLQDSTLLALGPKSVVQLNEFRYDPVKRDGNLLVSVLRGSMRFVTGLLGKQNPGSVSIRTPTATIGIRGTDFIVAVEGGE